MAAESTKDEGKPVLGRPRLIVRPWSRTGENPPYGILGRTVETSASFEARYAPPSYPTAEINRPNCLIIEGLRRIQVQADLDRLILTIQPSWQATREEEGAD
jgi:hypothetical protein